MNYKRILLKLSGESLMGNQQHGISPERLRNYVQEIKEVVNMGVQLAIVIGGGNFYRGLAGVTNGMDRVQGDYMGMMATVINSIALQSALEKINVKTEHLSGFNIERICENMNRRKAIQALEDGKVVIISGGTGNPFFTTDTASALRAIEIEADAIFKGTRVDGIYNSDPEKNPDSIKFDTLTHAQAYDLQLQIMDLTSFTLCKENNMPILVFDINTQGNLLRILKGEKLGTLVIS